MFITTANAVHNIPRPLLDRMEVLYIPGYTELEKLQIAERHLLPKQSGSTADGGSARHHEEALLHVIREYTRESGVRNLEQQIAAICRKAAKDDRVSSRQRHDRSSMRTTAEGISRPAEVSATAWRRRKTRSAP